MKQTKTSSVTKVSLLSLGLLFLLAMAAPVQAALLVPTNAPNWRLFKGTAEASTPNTLWRGSNFNDSAFVTAPAPFWYGDVRPGGTALNDMLNTYSCFFLRMPFVVTDVGSISALQTRFYIDDGFVMWINGIEVHRYAVTDPLTISTLAANQAVDPAVFEEVTLPTPVSNYLVNGTNFICIQVFNTTLASSDIGFDCQIVSVAPDLIPPTVTSKTPAPGTLNTLAQITVTFNEPVNGVDAADLLINGAAATGVSGVGDTYLFTFPQPAYGTVNITWAGAHNIQDFGIPPNAFDPATPGNTWQYTLVDNTPPVIVNLIPVANSVVRTLREIEVLFSEDVTGVDAGDLLINNVPATGVEFGVPGQFRFTFPEPPTGVVQVAWAPGHGIRDRATVPNNFAGGSWVYTLNPNVAFFDVRLNEIMADNQNGIRDEESSHQDWIELYNGGGTPVDLAGWFLTDNAGNLPKWRFPAGVQMGANSYLLVWASAKDRTNIGALHANFKLNKEGGFLALVLPDSNTVVSAFTPTYPAQRTDASYGRDRLDPSLLGFYNTPTPNAPNSVGGPGGFAPDVNYSLSSRTFVTPFNLTLSTSSTNAVIRYVLITNSTQASASVTNVPTASSPIYTGPIPIGVTTEVRARAFAAGLFPSTPRTESYIQISPNVLSYSSDVPVCIVHMLGNGSIPATATSGIIMAFDNDFDRSSLTNVPQVATRMGVHIRGSSTLNNPKSNLRVEFWDEFNQDAKYPLLGMPADSDWVFYGINGFDPGLMHNAIYQWLGWSLGIPSMRTRFVEMYRKVDGGPVTTNDYFGLYLLLETPKVGKDRLDIASLHDEDTNATAITGGYIMKIDRVDNERSFQPPQIGTVRTTPSAIAFTDPTYRSSPAETDPRRLMQINYAQNYILNFITNLSSASYTNPVTGYAQYIDPDEWVNHLIANIVPFNVDGYRLSGFIYKDRGDRLKQGPMWDCDRCMGTGGTATPQADNRCFNPRMWRGPVTSGDPDNGTDFFGLSTVGVNWFARLFRDPDFWQRFIDRYQNCRTNEYSNRAIVAMLDGFYDEIKEAQVREQARWAPSGFTYPRAGSQTVSFSGTTYTFDFGPADNFGRGRFTNEVNFQKKWLLDRLDFMDTNFLAMPVMLTGSAMVTNGTIISVQPAPKANTLLLYTLDGTDPRLPGGAVAPNIKTNVGALTLTVTNNIRLFARCYNTSHANMTNGLNEIGKPLINSFWSGPVAASYYTTVPPLRITEIMYHPAMAPAGNTNDQDNYEYLEFRNISASPLSLAGFRLRGGVQFDFPPFQLGAGSNCIVVRHLAAFQSRYGTSLPVVGVYSNNLANDGDHLVLEGSLGEPILAFDYQDGWYPITDGSGFSLQIVNENSTTDTWGFKASWRPSGSSLGTPGTTDSTVVGVAGILVNEVLPHTDPPLVDAIELCNTNATNVSIGGWFLTDDFKNPKRYRIPDGTQVPANGYLVLYASNTFGAAFSLSSLGDEVYLYSGDPLTTNLTGWVHGFDFGAQANGDTFGRYVVVSTGNDQFPTALAPTLGFANSLPRVGPVIITEINYHPPERQGLKMLRDNDIDEYIELSNLGPGNVPLYDPNFPSNTWKLREAVDYTFPAGTVITNGEYILVTQIDPADPAAVAAFRARNGVSPGVRLFGPFSGQLDNSADRVELARPDNPEVPPAPNAGFVPYVLVERVSYEDTPPWPAGADGIGPTLQRITAGAYGNDPANWTAAGKTPGGPYASGAGPTITQQPVDTVSIQTLSASLSLMATGPGPITYQWRKNGGVLPGKTNSILSFQNVSVNDAGTYNCVVLNPSGAVVSSNATLTVRIPATILAQPQSVNLRGSSNLVDYGNTTNNATFTVQAAGTGAVSYQWRFNGMNIGGANSTTLNVMNVQLTNDGTYDVLVTDDVATIPSAPARLSVLVTPVILQAPLAQTVPAGSLLNLSVAIRGNPPPFGYQWRSNSLVLPLIISDLQTNFFSIFAATNPVVATYRIVVTNAASQGNAVVATFLITTVADTDLDGVPDSVETALGLNPNNPADGIGDLDHDGVSNRDEYIAGTDLNDTNSFLRINQITVPGSATIQVAAVSNRTYSVQYSDLLPATTWQKLADLLARPTNRVELIVDPRWTTNRFYRLALPAQQ